MRRIKRISHKELKQLREKLLQEQEFTCPICQKVIENPVVDHHHTKRIGGTGRIRAVLCRTCNVLLAKMENNSIRYCVSQEELPSVLRKMADYLEAPQLGILHPTERPKKPKLKKSSYNKLIKEVANQQKVPKYPKSGNLTKPLEKLFKKFQIEPEFYKGK